MCASVRYKIQLLLLYLPFSHSRLSLGNSDVMFLPINGFRFISRDARWDFRSRQAGDFRYRTIGIVPKLWARSRLPMCNRKLQVPTPARGAVVDISHHSFAATSVNNGSGRCSNFLANVLYQCLWIGFVKLKRDRFQNLSSGDSAFGIDRTTCAASSRGNLS